MKQESNNQEVAESPKISDWTELFLENDVMEWLTFSLRKILEKLEILFKSQIGVTTVCLQDCFIFFGARSVDWTQAKTSVQC